MREQMWTRWRKQQQVFWGDLRPLPSSVGSPLLIMLTAFIRTLHLPEILNTLLSRMFIHVWTYPGGTCSVSILCLKAAFSSNHSFQCVFWADFPLSSLYLLICCLQEWCESVTVLPVIRIGGICREPWNWLTRKMKEVSCSSSSSEWTVQKKKKSQPVWTFWRCFFHVSPLCTQTKCWSWSSVWDKSLHPPFNLFYQPCCVIPPHGVEQADHGKISVIQKEGFQACNKAVSLSFPVPEVSFVKIHWMGVKDNIRFDKLSMDFIFWKMMYRQITPDNFGEKMI